MTVNVPPFDPANVQGDILVGLPKKVEHHLLFTIGDDVTAFRKALSTLLPLISTTNHVEQDRDKIAHMKATMRVQGEAPQRIKMSGINIAFTQAGLTKLGITDDIRDPVFAQGQLKDTQNLGDKGGIVNGAFVPTDWLPEFKGTIHGVIIMTGDCEGTIAQVLNTVNGIFNPAGQKPLLHEVTTLKGAARPGDLHAHEHFGFLDAVSQPAVQGINTNPNPGQETIRPGIILCGRDGDDLKKDRPSWSVDGSFLALRYLFQLVPEFNTFLERNPIKAIGLSSEQGSELLGARLVGRWKSGAPIDVTPTKDDPAMGSDPARNDNFRYDPNSEERCPYAAHTRKTNPRADLPSAITEHHRILRRGIQFGPEVTPEEAASGVSNPANGRGLIFVCYQSDLSKGFQFIQQSWANNIGFPFGKPNDPGFDAIVGQTTDDSIRNINGVDPGKPGGPLSLPMQWVVPKGGEYFFSPSIPALRTTFALAT